MATKEKPAPNDCYDKALADEPLFVLLARDPSSPELVRAWAKQRARSIANGEHRKEDIAKVYEALCCADEMETWRTENFGAWRNSPLAKAAEQTGEG